MGKLAIAFLLSVLYGCSSIQCAKAFVFVSTLDDQGKVTPYSTPRDVEDRVLYGDVKELNTKFIKVDSTGAEHTALFISTLWNENRVETDKTLWDSLGNVISRRTSQLDEQGRLLRKDVQGKNYTSVIFSSRQKEPEGTRWHYTRKDSTATVYEVSLLIDDSGKVKDIWILHPSALQLEQVYNDINKLEAVRIKGERSKRNSVSYTYDAYSNKLMERSVYSQGTLYSYESIQRNEDGKILDITYSDEITEQLDHIQYRYGKNKKVSKIISGGVTKQLLYENDKLVREEYFDYGGKLQVYTQIKTDDQGNVLESVYFKKKPRTDQFVEFQKYQYQIQYHR